MGLTMMPLIDVAVLTVEVGIMVNLHLEMTLILLISALFKNTGCCIIV